MENHTTVGRSPLVSSLHLSLPLGRYLFPSTHSPWLHYLVRGSSIYPTPNPHPHPHPQPYSLTRLLAHSHLHFPFFSFASLLFSSLLPQAGMGRTGTWWAHEQLMHTTPDILIFAKGIASGMPLGGIATTPEIFAACPPASLGGTYGGNPVVAAAAVATLNLMQNQDQDLLANARARVAQLETGLRRIAQESKERGHDVVLEVRGRGLMAGIELRGKGNAGRLAQGCLGKGLLVMTAGAKEVVRFLPPLSVSEEEMDDAMEIVGSVLQELKA